MKRVVTINLGGNAYQLDEDGYETLGRYLDSARARLAGNPDLGEIMSDLELAIADKASRFLSASKTVVSGGEIDEIVEEMGPVDMPPGEEGAAGGRESAAAAGPRPEREARREPRKLYRLTDPREKMLAGVCAGLAAYLGTDVSILRILALILALVSAGVALIGYVLLVFIVPAAETPEQRATAYGVPFDAQDVIDRAKSKFSEFRDEREARRQRRASQHYRERRARGGAHELLRWLLAVIVVVFGVMIALSFAVGLFRMFGISNLPGAWPAYYLGPNVFPGPLLLVLAIALIAWAFGRRSADGSSVLGSVLAGTAQLVLILALIWFAYHSLPFVRHVVDGTVMAVHHVVT